MSNSRTDRQRKLAVLSAAVLTAALALTGCSPSAEPMKPAASGAPVVVEKDLSLAAFSAPNSLDPAQLVDGQQMFVWSSVLDTLLRKDPDTGSTIPGAAEAWEYNSDGTELTLSLREGMTFSSGDPVNAEAVVKTLDRSRITPGNIQGRLSRIESVSATDDLTVVIKLTAFDPQLIDNLSSGPGAIGDPATMDQERTATDPIGSGPFILDVAKTVPGSSYVLTKRDEYWDAENVPFSTLTVKVIQDPTASFNALQSGEINASTVQSQMVSQLNPDDFTITENQAVATTILNILDRGGEKWPALGDQRVRQAINLAIDRKGIVKALYSGVGLETAQLPSPYGAIYDESLNKTYVYDPKAGRALVEEAGFAGETFQIPSTFLTGTIEPVLSQAFTDIGLNLEWVTVPPQQAQSAARSGDYGLYFQILGFNSDAADIATTIAVDNVGNPRNYTDPTLDALFAEINSTVDFEEALPAYKELNEYVVDQALVAPVVFSGTTWATGDGISYVGKANTLSTIRQFAVTE
ncbi:ABC transporter substrate-binding protein [Microterricola viridarii]|uniref:Peptide/nickel transport system substrate-binding protein n=1 Tax=Microterricola viridarii TaxID=412690 RepID=A0A1H1VBM6_9MICO|nr:ABC transporter substrate-binding protein [Microterricola viridarii]SDS82134.1 peptide/nickel transport system substrate-binding protein [Microterricola viridarii]